jgi:hypothetical protein
VVWQVGRGLGSGGPGMTGGGFWKVGGWMKRGDGKLGGHGVGEEEDGGFG